MQMRELNEYPQPAVLAAQERILAVNEKAAALFREMEAGGELPEVLHSVQGSWEGSVTTSRATLAYFMMVSFSSASLPSRHRSA